MSMRMAVAMIGATASLATGACGGHVDSQLISDDPTPLTPAEWERLANMRIFFGHQSVGANIMAGIDDVIREEKPAIRITDEPGLADVTVPAFVHHEVGRNGDPRSKTAAFAAALVGADRVGTKLRTVALHKYCFVDVDSTTDADTLFADYRAAMAELRNRHPEMVFVHVTMPLTSVGRPSAIKSLMKKMLRRAEYPEYALNVKRNRFNANLRRAYAGREPVFDLAALEATHNDGSRAFFVRDGDTVYTLAPEYTDDGGHLNTIARRRIALDLLHYLAAR